jgi:TrkA domain protein
MPEVRETKLPGVGVRHEFTAHDGTVVGVVEYHDGRSDVVVYDSEDPDVCSSMLHLDADDTRTLARLLGASELTAGVRDAQAEIEGLVFEWIKVPPGSSFSGRSIEEGQLRTRTGASVVAVLRADHSVPAPDSNFVIEADDTVVAVGTADGLAALRAILTG